jgi:hypothetical protein
MMNRNYRELRQLSAFEERFHYLALRGTVGQSTFGFDRWVNQGFYSSREWRQIRNRIIVRDEGCDLGVEGFEIHDRIYIHHINPITLKQLESGDPCLLDPDNLISVTHRTHNAIHYGDERLLPRPLVDRRPGDTKLW